MDSRGSLLDSVRLLLTPGRAANSRREEWLAIRRLSHWGNTQQFRRIVVLIWAGLLAIDPWIMVRLSQHFVFLARVPALLPITLSQLLITWLAFRAMCIGLAQPTIEDSAVMQFDTAFERLSHSQREELVHQRFRDFILGRLRKDEREAVLRTRAEVAAYRILRPGLALIGVVYWAICLSGPFQSARRTLLITAIAYTWLAVAILALPTLIRMWTQPNEAGETRIVNTENDM